MTHPTLTAVTRPSRIPRWLKRTTKYLLILTAVAYIGFCITLYCVQDRLIFRGHLRQGTDVTRVTPAADAQLVSLRAPSGAPLTGLFGPARRADDSPDPDYAQKPTVLFFYGNSACMNFAIKYFDMFRRLNVNCMLIDYEGYGMSGGSASEKNCYTSAEAAYQYLLTRPDINPNRIVAAGWSLGGAVAIDLAYRHRNDKTVCGLVTFGTFSSMAAVAHDKYPAFPVSLLLKYRFASRQKINDIHVPYFLGHGEGDSFIPFTEADRLARAAAGPVTRFSQPQAGHLDFFSKSGPALPEALALFLTQIQ